MTPMQHLALTPEDLNNNIIFLNRVDLKGNESQAHAVLVAKFSAMLEATNAPQEQETEAPIEPANIAEFVAQERQENAEGKVPAPRKTKGKAKGK